MKYEQRYRNLNRNLFAFYSKQKVGNFFFFIGKFTLSFYRFIFCVVQQNYFHEHICIYTTLLIYLKNQNVLLEIL